MAKLTDISDRSGRLVPFAVGDEIGGFKVLSVGDDHSHRDRQNYHVERTCECRERLTISHRKIVERHGRKSVCCRECAMAHLSYRRQMNPLRRVWTEEMDARLREWAGRLPAHAIAEKLGLRNADGVYRRAVRLNLSLRSARRHA